MTIDKIKSIKKIKSNSNRYDIEIYKNHCYFANGMLVHNSSGTFFVKDYVFGVCSRNLELKPDENNSFWKMAYKYKIEEKLKSHFPNRNIVLQGECYGPGIQDNQLGVGETSFSAFNLFDIDTQTYLDFEDLRVFCINADIPMVSVLERGDNFTHTLETLQDIANNLKYDNGNPAEGIVIRPLVERQSNVLNGRLSGKVISEIYELRHG